MGQAEMLEDDKIFFHHWLMSRKELTNAEMWQIEGVDALEHFLRKRDDVFIKCNDRGDFETYKHRTWKLTEDWFRRKMSALGPYRDTLQVIAQEPVEGIEVGYDGYLIDGDYPPTAQYGFECKGLGYVGKFTPYLELPDPLLTVCQAVGSWIQEERFVSRGIFSSEVRISDSKTGYFIDPTMRCGLPPSACQAALPLFGATDDIIGLSSRRVEELGRDRMERGARRARRHRPTRKVPCRVTIQQ